MNFDSYRTYELWELVREIEAEICRRSAELDKQFSEPPERADDNT